MHREEHFLQQRNRKVGAILERARLLQRRTVTECAALLKTSRRRYTAIERGDIAISFTEMEVILQYLNIADLIETQEAFVVDARSLLTMFESINKSSSK